MIQNVKKVLFVMTDLLQKFLILLKWKKINVWQFGWIIQMLF
jgi:hypothetical protein